jgi:catechol 2,3-dioxygenase
VPQKIGTYIAPTRRPNQLGVHSLDHFALAVPDLEAARRYYAAFGLNVVEHGEALHIHTHGHAHRWGVLTEGPRKALQYLSFGVFAEDLEPFRTRLDRLGVPLVPPPPGMAEDGLWFYDSDGTLIEVKIAEKSSLNAKAPAGMAVGAPNLHNAPFRGTAPPVRPRRMAHVLLFTADVSRTVAFYQGVLGLRLSDEAGGVIAFMHGVHGSDHHIVAFAQSAGPGLHHCSWDVGSIDDIGLGAMQMADKGFVAGWGLGRHVLGSNYFHYVRDPWGSYCEYSCDIDFVPADQDWDTRSHDIENSLYLWGPAPPRDFTVNHELLAEAARA